jgi:hypothetical protein
MFQAAKFPSYTIITSILFTCALATSCTGLTKDNPDETINIEVENRDNFIESYSKYKDSTINVSKIEEIHRDKYIESAAILTGGRLQIVIREPFKDGNFIISCYRDRVRNI